MARIATYPSAEPIATEPPDYRAALVRIAESQIGVTDPEPYWLDVHGSVPVPARGKRIHWCGAFVLWCLRQAGLCDWRWSFSQAQQPGFIFRIGWKNATRRPLPGDVCYVEHAQHHALVCGSENGIIYTIDGNTGVAPGIVARSKGRSVSLYDVHYYSIQGLVDAAAKRWREQNP